MDACLATRNHFSEVQEKLVTCCWSSDPDDQYNQAQVTFVFSLRDDFYCSWPWGQRGDSKLSWAEQLGFEEKVTGRINIPSPWKFRRRSRKFPQRETDKEWGKNPALYVSARKIYRSTRAPGPDVRAQVVLAAGRCLARRWLLLTNLDGLDTGRAIRVESYLGRLDLWARKGSRRRSRAVAILERTISEAGLNKTWTWESNGWSLESC